MAKTTKNLTIDRGNTQNVTLSVSDPESIPAIQPSDIIYFTAKKTYDNDATDSAAVIAKTMNASEVLDPTTGVITFKLTASDLNIIPDKYVYDIVLRQADYDRVTLLKGKLTINPAATLRGF